MAIRSKTAQSSKRFITATPDDSGRTNPTTSPGDTAEAFLSRQCTIATGLLESRHVHRLADISGFELTPLLRRDHLIALQRFQRLVESHRRRTRQHLRRLNRSLRRGEGQQQGCSEPAQCQRLKAISLARL